MNAKNQAPSLVLKNLADNFARENLSGIPRDWFENIKILNERKTKDITGNLETGTSSLFELEQEALQCQKCRLCETRNKVVFGVGNTNSPEIMFIGEGPGADEDQQGEPFVGKAGELLTAAITSGLKMKRESIYICNVVKCRPPQNRTPLPDEVSNCLPYLKKQIELIKPKIIVTLGGPAQKAIIGKELGITKLRGQWNSYDLVSGRSIPVMPTYHPAYILRSPSAKRPFWEDLQEVLLKLSNLI